MQTTAFVFSLVTMWLAAASLVRANLPDEVADMMKEAQTKAAEVGQDVADIEKETIRKLKLIPEVENVSYKVVYVNDDQVPCFLNRCYLNWGYRDLSDPLYPVSRFGYCSCAPGREEKAGHSCCCCCGKCGCRGGGQLEKPCVKYCTAKATDKCQGGMVWTECSTSCKPTCQDPRPVCLPTCSPARCQCPPDKPIWSDAEERCVSDEMCEGHCNGDQVWNDCGSGCTKTCQEPNPTCTKDCVKRCECPSTAPIWHLGKCISQKQCLTKLKIDLSGLLLRKSFLSQ